MNVLFIHPQISRSRLAFRYSLALVRDRIIAPPLNLLTVAAGLPTDWGKRLVDLNISELMDDDLRWASCAVVQANELQRVSARKAVRRCREAGLRVLGYGNAFHRRHIRLQLIDHLGTSVLDCDLAADCAGLTGSTRTGAPRPIDLHPDPAWNLVNLSEYEMVTIPVADSEAAMPISSGEKPSDVSGPALKWVFRQLDRLHSLGWRGRISLRRESSDAVPRRAWPTKCLDALARWRETREGVTFGAEVTVDDVADAQQLQRLTRAGIRDVFLRFDPQSVSGGSFGAREEGESRLMDVFKRAQRHGLQIRGGFLTRRTTGASDAMKRAVARIRCLRMDRALTILLHAPLGIRHLGPAIGSLFETGLSARTVLRILRRALGTALRRPRSLPLAFTLSVYAELYENTRRIGALA